MLQPDKLSGALLCVSPGVDNQNMHKNEKTKSIKAEGAMIDLHCHILPGIDDGSPDLLTSLEMARMSVDDGVVVLACTPHIYPGLYENSASGIRSSMDALADEFQKNDIQLRLIEGADVHAAPELIAQLKAGQVPTLNNTRYFLLEPPHNVAPPRFESYVFSLLAAGYTPIITHPERLKWIEDNYSIFVELVRQGAWMQITSGSLCGRFGSRARYWAERMLDEAVVHILASDGHGIKKRPPLLSEGKQMAEKWIGKEEAEKMVWTRPLGIINNEEPGLFEVEGRLSSGKKIKKKGLFSYLFRK